jgi:hypothetical protein
MVFHGEIPLIEELLVVWIKTVVSMSLSAREPWREPAAA